jgi:hypothetical protein
MRKFFSSLSPVVSTLRLLKSFVYKVEFHILLHVIKTSTTLQCGERWAKALLHMTRGWIFFSFYFWFSYLSHVDEMKLSCKTTSSFHISWRRRKTRKHILRFLNFYKHKFFFVDLALTYFQITKVTFLYLDMGKIEKNLLLNNFFLIKKCISIFHFIEILINHLQKNLNVNSIYLFHQKKKWNEF